MKQTKTLIAVFLMVVTGTVTKLSGQNDFKTANIFSSDSLTGFDEPAASALALTNACYGNEFKVFMNREKRRFIINKYNIQIPAQEAFVYHAPPVSHGLLSNGKSMVLSSGACNNDDFEDAQGNPGPQVGGPVNGWTILGGSSANYCSPATNGSTPNYTVFNSLTTDPIMIAPNNTIASYYDANSFNQPAGNCFIRLNNASAGSKVVKATKTYTISPNNAVFRYAYKAVISNPNHSCCDQPGFHIKVTITNTATSSSTLLACPNISVAAGTSCGPATPGFITGNLLNGSPSSYNPNWVPGSLDLSGYIGFAVTLDVYAVDCALGGHAGYVYFDALCSPMTIVGNGQGFPAGSSSITIPTCGSSGGTLTAPPGLGPYSWNSNQITIPSGYTTPSFTNQTLVTNQSGTLSLTMNPAGSCSVITKILTVTITPAPIVVASSTQASCSNSLSAASLTTAGSASVNPIITWSPPPNFISANSHSATGLAVGITTITVTDNIGCQAQATVNTLASPPPVTFQVNNLSGSFSLSCINPTINLSATTNYTYGTLNYNWSSISFTSSASTVALTQAGNYNVCGIDAASSCSMCQTFTINQNFAIPTSSVNPVNQVITCNTVSAATFTSAAQSPTTNIVQNWYSPQNPYPVGPAAATTNNQFSLFTALAPGIYTVEVCDLVNGCCNTKTVSVTSTSGFPTFNTSSTSNYSVGCSSKSVTTLCMINAVSASSAGVTYLFLPPGTPSAVPASTTAFGASSCMSLTTPGNWTVVVNDVGNGCQTALQVPILQNTFPPNVSASYAPATQTLTCFNPTILATGTSSTPGTFITWNVPSTPPLLSTSTVVLGPVTGPLTSLTNTVYATYTVIATNTVNLCKATQTIVVNQNFRVPTPLTAIGTPTALYCTGQPVVLSYTNNAANSGIAGAVGQLVSWMGPAPQTSAAVQAYNAFIPGIYTLTVRDSYNGCLGVKTVTVLDQTQPPVLVNPVSTFTLDCGANTGSSGQSSPMQIVLSQSLTSWSFLFTEYPLGANFGPGPAGQAAITAPNGLTSSGSTTSQAITTDKTGTFNYVVINLTTGCRSTGTINMVPGALVADFTADPLTGYAPLGVNFTNNSASSANSNSITSVWSFGNGTSQTTTTNISPSTNYTSPGTYTVTMIASKGLCVDTAYAVIKVEIPSKLDVPNVFTPNGDGSNDLFFLKTQNLTEITALIFDRWGSKVYDITSSTGNIGWDGKNQEGKECPSGTYFYIIKATGKDGSSYDKKGNVSLYR